ncbi:MAG TPA: response regulator transcription factor [Candidatus Acidoferrales bacterium]|jgi:DNA-binding NarL/FixJ family response regulator|nr:response regulator transcription factor [Candidatus Acidoferrales bacterium]
MKTIKVAIVEDDARFRKSLRRVLESRPGLVCIAEYGTGAEAIERIPRDLPEVVLMDLNLPDSSGAEVTARLKSQLPDISVVILTVYNAAEHIFKALRAGADGYLLKQATAAEILEAVAEAHRGGAPMSSEIARKVIAAFHEPKPAPAATETLAPREREILELVANGYANKEIADKLAITLSTVCWYLHEIYKKLHVQSRVQAVNKLRESSGRHPSS